MRRPSASATDLAASLLSCFDLHAGRVVTRIAVGGAFVAISICVLRQSLAIIFPLALLIAANRRTLAVSYTELLERRPWLVVLVPLVVLTYVCASPPPTALDDLLRHIASSLRPNGYADMYAYARISGVPFYWGFDHFVGAMARAFGPAPALWIVQSLAAIAFCGAYVGAARRLVAASPDRPYWIAGGLFLAIGVMLFRILLGRPEIFMTSWLLAALIPRSPREILLWIAVGVLLSLGYWAAPVYFVGIVLLPVSWRTRVLVGAVLAASWAVGWTLITDGRFFLELTGALGGLGARIAQIRVGENQSIFGALGQPAGVVLLLACAWALSLPNRRVDIAGLALLFILTNQSRYISVVGPLLSLFAISASSAIPLRWPMGGKPIFVLALSLLATAPYGQIPRFGDLPDFKLPDGAIVLTAFDESTYAIPFSNPGRVRVSPSFEIGATQPEVQQLVFDLSEGRLDCARVSTFEFTHVIETRLSGSVKPCLHLLATRGAWRLWRVSR